MPRLDVIALGTILALALTAPAPAHAQTSLPPNMIERLELLDTLKSRGLISNAEHATRRRALLDSIAPAARGDTDITTRALKPTSHRFDGTWTGIGIYEVNEDGRCPNIDIALSIDGTRVSGTVTGQLMGDHALEGTISDAGVVSARTTQGNYNVQLSGSLEDGDWSFTFCSGSFSLSRADD